MLANPLCEFSELEVVVGRRSENGAAKWTSRSCLASVTNLGLHDQPLVISKELSIGPVFAVVVVVVSILRHMERPRSGL